MNICKSSAGKKFPSPYLSSNRSTGSDEPSGTAADGSDSPNPCGSPLPPWRPSAEGSVSGYPGVAKPRVATIVCGATRCLGRWSWSTPSLSCFALRRQRPDVRIVSGPPIFLKGLAFPGVVLLCHLFLARVCCLCRQQGQRGRRWTRPTVRRRRMLAIECGTCRSGRTGAARPEASG